MLSQRRQEWASPIEEFSIGDSVDGWDAGMAMACRQGGRRWAPLTSLWLAAAGGGGLSPHAGVNTLDALAPLDCSTCASVPFPVTTDSPSSSSSTIHHPSHPPCACLAELSAGVGCARANTKQPLALCRHLPRHDDHRRILELPVCAIALHSRDKHVPRGEANCCSVPLEHPHRVPSRSLARSHSREFLKYIVTRIASHRASAVLRDTRGLDRLEVIVWT